MNKVEIKHSEVIEKLNKMKNQKTKNIVWTSFPYTKQNLETIKDAINKFSENKNDYRLTYDENIIFIDKDSFEMNP